MKPSLADIQWVICTKFQITKAELRGPYGPRRITRPRHIAMYLAREVSQNSLPRIGQWLNRDHTTILYGIRKMRSAAQSDHILAGHIAECVAAMPTAFH